LLCALLGGLILLLATGTVQGGQIVVVLTNESSYYASAKDGFTTALAQRKADIRTVLLADVKKQGLAAIVGAPADMIVAVGTAAAVYVHDNAPAGTPVVCCLVGDAAANKLTQGRAVAGVTIDVPVADQFNLVAQALPKAQVMGMLYRSNTPEGQQQLKTAQEALPKGWRLSAIAVDQCDSVGDAINKLIDRKADCIWTSIEAGIYDKDAIPALLLAALRAKIPVFGFSPAFVKAGAAIGIGISATAQGEQAGAMAQKILANGTQGAASQIQPPQQFQIAVNQIVAEQIGVQLPAELVGKATYVFKEEDK
jgi:ABC-type uncharacterized transport system substrate-binding protein